MDKSAHKIFQNRIFRGVQPVLYASLITVSQMLAPSGDALAEARPPEAAPRGTIGHLSAEAAALIDVDSGRILFEKNGDRPMRVASLTKIITAYVALRSGRLSDIVTVSKNAIRQEGSSVYLSEGERQTLKNLLYAMMLRSGNDAATAIAEHIAGTSDRFSQRMNMEMRRLGLTHTHFCNPHGLDHPGHYSTAHDMAAVTAAALRDPVFRSIVSTRFYTIPWPGEKWDRKMRNKNKMLWRMPEADGVKTGYTRKAGRCLASSATSNGRQVAAVVLRAPDDWNDSERLLRYGLTEFPRRDLTGLPRDLPAARVRFGVVRQVSLRARGPVYYPLRAEEIQGVTARVTKLRRLVAPVRSGTAAGAVEYVFQGRVIGRAPLVTAGSVRARGWLSRLQEFIFG